MPVGAGIAAVGSLGGALIGSGAAKSAANTQAEYGQQSLAMQQKMFDQIRASLAPYMGYGQSAGNSLTKLLGLGEGGDPMNSPLLKAFAPTEAQLMETPGYKFDLSQGLRSTQAGAAARGLGASGAAVRGASQFATGLADTTYGQQYQRYMDTQNSQYNKLLGLTNLGESAASQQGNIGAATAQSMGNTTTGIGNSIAAGQVGSANAWSSALQSLPQYYMAAQMYGGGGMYGGNGTGSWDGQG